MILKCVEASLLRCKSDGRCVSVCLDLKIFVMNLVTSKNVAKDQQIRLKFQAKSVAIANSFCHQAIHFISIVVGSIIQSTLLVLSIS